MQSVLFDVDDTLYDQLQPFQKAFKKVFPKFNDVLIEKIYMASRRYSDEMFDKAESGAISLTELHTQRIIRAFRQCGRELTIAEAITFQKHYELEQGKISLFPEVEQLLHLLSENQVQLAILTNGPFEHQMKKIVQLNLFRWIQKEHIFISEEIGVAKPEPGAFHYIENKMVLSENPIYIGDSFLNDIVGAKRVGWQAIWMNHRNKQPEHSQVQPDEMVQTPCQLLNYFKNKFK